MYLFNIISFELKIYLQAKTNRKKKKILTYLIIFIYFFINNKVKTLTTTEIKTKIKE